MCTTACFIHLFSEASFTHRSLKSSKSPEWQSDGIESQSLLAVDDGREISNLTKVPWIGIVGIQPINHGGPNLKAEPIKALHTAKDSIS